MTYLRTLENQYQAAHQVLARDTPSMMYPLSVFKGNHTNSLGGIQLATWELHSNIMMYFVVGERMVLGLHEGQIFRVMHVIV